jgi:phospholipase C
MPPRIEHLVVLMLENRSFDHMFGFFEIENPAKRGDEIDTCGAVGANPGLDGTPVVTSPTAAYAGDFQIDPGHSFQDVNVQLFGKADPQPNDDLTLDGFVRNYAQQPGVKPENAGNVMRCFDPSRIPVLTTLAQQFAVCDRWFASVPGPTLPNRSFAHGATSNGRVDMNPLSYARINTLYEKLEQYNVSSKVYCFDGNSLAVLFPYLHRDGDRFLGSFEDFLDDCENDELPDYAFVEPRYNNYHDDATHQAYFACDQHPDNSVKHGEEFIAQVYSAIRGSDAWDSTLLVIVYDEHGGLYDHVAPPRGVPNPDGKIELTTLFDFTRLGARVPAVLVSPFIAPGTILHTQFEHASLSATAHKIFVDRAGDTGLNARDQAANTFESALTLARARRDAPEDVAAPQPVASAVFVGAAHGTEPLSEHQHSQVLMAYHLDVTLAPERRVLGRELGLTTIQDVNTQQLAATYIKLVASRFSSSFR